MIQEGTLLAGKYRVERLLGAGGMGYVVAAMHEQLAQRVAVKLLVPELCENKDAVERFLREARAAVRIQSEHVARVLDVGEFEGGGPYMVMEFLSGHDLAQELAQRDQLEARDAVDYILQASEAVAEAHSLGVIHRDLKPANLFLTRRPDGSPFVKVLDFGISKAITPDSGAHGKSLTAPQSLLGSPAYMSPEQVKRPKTVDTRTDIWSLGTILYELLSGEPPFHGDTPLSVLASVVSDPTPSLRNRRPDISPEFERIIETCLEKDPAARYQSVAEFAQALAPHAPSSSLHSVSRISGILRSTGRPSGAASTTLRSESAPPLAEADTEMTEALEVSSVSQREKQTHTDWGASQPIMERSRRRTRLVVAAVVAAGAAAAVALVRPMSRVASAPEAVSPRPEASTATRVDSTRLAAVPEVTPVPAGSAPGRAPDAGGAPVTPANRAKFKGQKAISATVVATGRPKPPAAAASPAKPPSEDPLEGRR